MRVFWVLLLLMPFPAAAQTVVFEDDARDVQMSTPDGRLQNRLLPGAFPAIDLRAGGIDAETEDQIDFFVNVTALEPAADPSVPYSDPVYQYYLRYGERGYRLTAIVDLTTPFDGVTGSQVTRGNIAVEYEEETYTQVAEIEVTADFAGDRVIFHVPRAVIRDHDETPLGQGERLWDMYAYGRVLGWFGIPLVIGQNYRIEAGPPAFSDYAPNDPRRGVAYHTVTGTKLHGGDLIASAADPVRWTNGEATTFVFYIRLQNLGGADVEVLLGHEKADPSWQVAFSDRLTVPAKGAINVTFHVAIPFSHAHGKLHEFKATFQSEDGHDWAKAPLAVYWPVIPQPAGHHPRLWFHSRYEPRDPPFETMGDNVRGWLSAAAPETEVNDERLPIPADRIDHVTGAQFKAQWPLKLEPALRMGLDFDLQIPMEGTIAMELPLPVSKPTLHLDLVHVDRRFIIHRETVLLEASSSLTGERTGKVFFEFSDVLPNPAADLIRHLPRSELEFRLNLTGTFLGHGVENPEEFTPTILPGPSQLLLPLNEYHDPLETVFWTDASATITVGDQGQQKPANSGDQVVFNFFLHYDGTYSTAFKTEVAGVNADWARPLGAATFKMEPGTVREVAVAVQVPRSAGVGQYAELSIKVVGTVNAAVQAGMIVRVDVVDDQNIRDETDLANEKAADLAAPPEKRGLGWLWILVSVIVAAAAGGYAWYRKRW